MVNFALNAHMSTVNFMACGKSIGTTVNFGKKAHISMEKNVECGNITTKMAQ
jgi:hypothetical protein